MSRRILELLRASGVGLFATAADLGTLALLVHGFGLSAQAANVPALLAGAAVQFLGARAIVFPASGSFARQLGRFAVAELGTLALNALAFALLVHFTSLPAVAARLASTSLVFVGYSLPAWRIALAADQASSSM